MNIRKQLYFGLVGLRGQALGAHYERFLRETQEGIPADTSKKLLVQLLAHCRQSVPYYAEIMKSRGGSFQEDPEEYLLNFPVLSKEILRKQFNALKSSDLSERKWYYETSGGSTGEPARFIQDWDYSAKMGALKLLYSKFIGSEIGEPEVHLWASPHDISYLATKRAEFITGLCNAIVLDAFRMTPDDMREYVRVINTKKPRLIIAYSDSIYLLARFIEREGLKVLPQQAIISTAGMLCPGMREKVEKVFQCKVYDRYGSREVGDIACERPGYEGFWVAPWGVYLEVVDKDGNRLPDGMDGEILVTSLANYAMPIIRYKIGDIGTLSPHTPDPGVQILRSILGRTVDDFKTRDGALLHAGNFKAILYFHDWILKYQVIQKSYTHIVYRIVKAGPEAPQAEMDKITAKTRHVMGEDCEVTFEFVDEISESDSGKYRYIICELDQETIWQ